MTNKTESAPAFPLFLPGDDSHKDWWTPGMTLRDWFAGQALNGLLANPKLADEIRKTGNAYGGWIEQSAYGWADAMLSVKESSEQQDTTS